MQEINLYVPELQPRELSFSANFCVFASLIFLVVLCGIQFIAHNSLENLQRNVETLENQKAASSERIAQIKTSSIYASSVLLDQHIEELRSQIRDRQNVGKIIEWQNLGNEEGFAHVLESLARHSSEQFSLQRIRLSAGGNNLEFSGETRRAEAIPLYLQALQTDANMAHTRFGLLSIGGDEDIKQFSLGFDTVYKLAGEKKMKALIERWNILAEKLNGLNTRERALIAVSLLLCIYLIWDFGFYQPLTRQREDLELRMHAAQTDLLKLNAEEQVFAKTLKNDPGAAKKRELVRLEQELKTLDEELQQLAVGLIAAEKLPQVLYEVLQKSSSLKFVGMQTHPVELLSFNKVLASLEAEQKKNGQQPSINQKTPEQEKEIDLAISEAKGRENKQDANLQSEREVGVFKHSVTVSFEGNYFSVIRYLKSLEDLEWKIYWHKLDYKVASFPRAQITLEVFTLSTQQGVLGATI